MCQNLTVNHGKSRKHLLKSVWINQYRLWRQ
jgi:hypothetical protein